MPPTRHLFSIKCLFRHAPMSDDKAAHIYEERITTWLAENEDEAIQLAETEAYDYANSLSQGSEHPVEYIHYCMAYSTQEEQFASGLETFSLMRDSDLNPDEYIDSFYDTGSERTRTKPQTEN